MSNTFDILFISLLYFLYYIAKSFIFQQLFEKQPDKRPRGDKRGDVADKRAGDRVPRVLDSRRAVINAYGIHGGLA